MKFFVAFILTGLLSFAGTLFFPWWVIAVAAFIVAVVIPQHWLLSFISAFLALFILWGAHSFIIDSNNDHILATRVASVLPLRGSYILVIGFTAFIGGIVAGLAALTGSFLRTSAKVKRVEG